ncbi:polysaccharide deacetylase family protein [Oscillatoria sp. CS-180]|uniref:polysaccharide deacetylase family protein n=1 Tax=Oscillatoria sp. CS-180 TaxID=3021720 RepID=UPI00232C5B6A|nr:polysaccharide deacetylase family protein [Oscillatoria sp. CS-180]MDB9527788.1 polysaccharide deacetylase family protein [Oscillatoria sp. CS-180]
MQPTFRRTISLKRPRSRPHWFKYVWLASVVATLIVLSVNVLWPNRYFAPWLFGEGVYKVQTTEKIVALTFDDGPDPRYSAQIGQILADAGAKGTFFVMGRHVEQYPDVVRTLIEQGHELGNHTWSHPSLRMMTPQAIRTELESTDQLLRELGYTKTIPFRSPYGHSLFILPHVLKQRQQPNVLWTVQMNDWKPEDPDVMMDLLAPEFENGAIILMHDGDGESEGADRSNTILLVQRILDKYQAQGYRFVTVSELLANGRPQRRQ